MNLVFQKNSGTYKTGKESNMGRTITIRSVSTEDVLIAQAALEKLGFKTLHEMDVVDAYVVIMSVPEEHAHIEKEVTLNVGLCQTHKRLFKT